MAKAVEKSKDKPTTKKVKEVVEEVDVVEVPENIPENITILDEVTEEELISEVIEESEVEAIEEIEEEIELKEELVEVNEDLIEILEQQDLVENLGQAGQIGIDDTGLVGQSTYDENFKNTLKEENENLKKEIETLKINLRRSQSENDGNIEYKYTKSTDVYYTRKYGTKRFTVLGGRGNSANGPLYKLYCKAEDIIVDLIPEDYLEPANNF